MQPLSSLSSIAARYDVFFLDLWGVVHDGSALYPGVRDTLVALRGVGKKILFLSNAPRRSHKVARVLGELGIEPALYDHVVSSGEVGYRWLEAGNAPFGKRYFFIGPQRDADVLDGLDFTAAATLEQADFLLNVGFGTEEQTTHDYGPLLADARALALPMLCLNPDLEVVKITGGRFPCAGVLGKAYEALGGSVTWFGKPYDAVYGYAHALVGGVAKDKILAIGDSLETDIPGAKQFGIDSILVTGGILKGHSPAAIEALCENPVLRPTYRMEKFSW